MSQPAGPGLDLPPHNIAAPPRRRAREAPFRRAVVVPCGRDRAGRTRYVHATFEQLDRLTSRCAHGLRALGVERGERVLLLVRPSIELVALTNAVFALGAVAVFIDPGMGLDNLVASVARIAPRTVIAVPRAQVALSLLGRRALRTVARRVWVGSRAWLGGTGLARLVAGAPADEFPIVPTGPDEAAAVLFTSGSTGPAKGVVYTHAMFFAQLRLLDEVYGIAPGEVDLPGLPVFALFSVALGATVVFPDMDASRPARLDPARFVQAIEDHGVSYSFGSPAIWGPVSAHCLAHGVALPSLRRVLMAGAPVPPRLHEALERLLPAEADTFTPYGATEALPVCSVSGRELAETFAATREGAGTCVGPPVPGVTLRIIRISDDPIPEWRDDLMLPRGEIGEVVVRGDVVTREYCELAEATALAKIRQGERVWHRMGDLGYLDERGRLWFVGRKSHRVVTFDGVLFPVRCEQVFNEHPRVQRTALVGAGPRGAQLPVLVVQPRAGLMPAGPDDERRFRDELLALGAKNPLTREIREVLFRPELPVDVRHNAKIRREDLAVWATKLLPAPRTEGG